MLIPNWQKSSSSTSSSIITVKLSLDLRLVTSKIEVGLGFFISLVSNTVFMKTFNPAELIFFLGDNTVSLDDSASVDIMITAGLYSMLPLWPWGTQLWMDLPSLLSAGSEPSSRSRIWGSDWGMPTQVTMDLCSWGTYATGWQLQWMFCDRCWLIPCFLCGHDKAALKRLTKSLSSLEPLFLLLTNLGIWWRAAHTGVTRDLWAGHRMAQVLLRTLWSLLAYYSVRPLWPWGSFEKTYQVSQVIVDEHEQIAMSEIIQ